MFTKSLTVASNHGHDRTSLRSLSIRSVLGRRPMRSGRKRYSEERRGMFRRRKVWGWRCRRSGDGICRLRSRRRVWDEGLPLKNWSHGARRRRMSLERKVLNRRRNDPVLRVGTVESSRHRPVSVGHRPDKSRETTRLPFCVVVGVDWRRVEIFLRFEVRKSRWEGLDSIYARMDVPCTKYRMTGRKECPSPKDASSQEISRISGGVDRGSKDSPRNKYNSEGRGCNRDMIRKGKRGRGRIY